jgi:hypothetical protein
MASARIGASQPHFIANSVFKSLGLLSFVKMKRGPVAELTPVPAERQAKVAQSVRSQLAELIQKSPQSKRAAVNDLIAHVGLPDFYETVAKLDPSDAAAWKDMATVQARFAAAEVGYDPKTRAYSESMRLTLHASVIAHFAFPKENNGTPLFERFVELHPTAFHQNGAWLTNLQIPLSGALAIIQATPAKMWMQAAELAEGAFITDKPTIAAANMVREARKAALKNAWK